MTETTQQVKRGRPSKTFVFMLDGQEIVVENLVQYCKDNNLHYSGLTNLSYGLQKTCKGHTFVRMG